MSSSAARPAPLHPPILYRCKICGKSFQGRYYAVPTAFGYDILCPACYAKRRGNS